MAPVAQLLAMDRSTLTAALKPLARQGWVRIEPDPSDRRSRLLILTDAGHAALADAVPIWQETHAAIEATLTDIDIDADALRSGIAVMA